VRETNNGNIANDGWTQVFGLPLNNQTCGGNLTGGSAINGKDTGVGAVQPSQAAYTE